MKPLVILLSCFLTCSSVRGMESASIVWPQRIDSSAPSFVAGSLHLTPPFEFETVIRPEQFTGKDAVVTWDFLDKNRDGYRIKFAPRDGGIRLLQIKQGRPTPNPAIRQSLRIPLSEGDYTYQLPLRLRLLVGQSRTQLYLGALAMPAKAIVAEAPGVASVLSTVMIRATNARAVVASTTLAQSAQEPPDINLRPPVGHSMPTFSEFVGTHYEARPYFSLYRGLFYEPVIYRIAPPPERDHRPWVTYVNKEMLPAGCEPRIGPFSGQKVYVRFDKIRSILQWADKHKALMIHGRDVLKRDEYNRPQEVMLRKDELYWAVRAFHEGRKPEDVPLLFQLGNEVNRFGIGWREHPHVADRYVEQQFAPAVEAVRRVSQDLYGSPDRIPVLLGSVTRPEPTVAAFLLRVANSTIEGDFAPSLAGMKVFDLANCAAVQYAMSGPFWRQSLDLLHDELIATGKMDGLWSTEELGGNPHLPRGPFTLAMTMRYMDWWSRHDWSPRKGGLVLWGDQRSPDDPSTTRDVLSFLHDTLGARKLKNLTDDFSFAGDNDLEGYLFQTDDSRPPLWVGAVFSRDYVNSSELKPHGTATIQKMVAKVGSDAGTGSLHGMAFLLDDRNIALLWKGGLAVSADNTLSLPITATLDREAQQALVFCVGKELPQAAHDWTRFAPRSNEANNQEMVALYMHGNYWDLPAGGMDRGMAGDEHGLLVNDYFGNEATFPVELIRGWKSGERVRITVEFSGTPADVFWDEINLGMLPENTDRCVIDIPRESFGKFGHGWHKFVVRNNKGEITYVDSLLIEYL